MNTLDDISQKLLIYSKFRLSKKYNDYITVNSTNSLYQNNASCKAKKCIISVKEPEQTKGKKNIPQLRNIWQAIESKIWKKQNRIQIVKKKTKNKKNNTFKRYPIFEFSTRNSENPKFDRQEHKIEKVISLEPQENSLSNHYIGVHTLYDIYLSC